MVSQGIDVVMDITVPGSLAIMRNYPECITLFLMPPSFAELKRRLENAAQKSLKCHAGACRKPAKRSAWPPVSIQGRQ
jgi:guanylate kinase